MTLYCDEVYICVKTGMYPMTSKRVAKNLGIKPKVARASLEFAAKYMHTDLVCEQRNPLNALNKRTIWSCKQ